LGRVDGLESSLLFLRQRSLQGCARKQVKKLQEMQTKADEAREFFIGFRENGETNEELEHRAKSLYKAYISEPASPATAADKLASDYTFNKTLLKKGRLGGTGLRCITESRN
jgi:hypothetical protein